MGGYPFGLMLAMLAVDSARSIRQAYNPAHVLRYWRGSTCRAVTGAGDCQLSLATEEGDLCDRRAGRARAPATSSPFQQPVSGRPRFDAGADHCGVRFRKDKKGGWSGEGDRHALGRAQHAGVEMPPPPLVGTGRRARRALPLKEANKLDEQGADLRAQRRPSPFAHRGQPAAIEPGHPLATRGCRVQDCGLVAVHARGQYRRQVRVLACQAANGLQLQRKHRHRSGGAGGFGRHRFPRHRRPRPKGTAWRTRGDRRGMARRRRSRL